jgi:[acyl-carrier-protein] S-malonyltransferase
VTSGAEAKKLALTQITSPVRWTDEEAAIVAAGGFDLLLECGPGKTLQGLWKDTGSELPCRSAGTCIDINNLITEFTDVSGKQESAGNGSIPGPGPRDI